MRRFIALTATAALALTLAPFSEAQAAEDDLVVTIGKPAEGEYAGTIDVQASINANSGGSIKKWEVHLANSNGDILGTFCSTTYPAPGFGDPGKTRVDVNFNWNTKLLPTAQGNCEGGGVLPLAGSALPNNKYKILVYGENFPPFIGDADQDLVYSGELKISNPPDKPSGMKLTYDEGAETIGISWNAVTSADPIDYRIQECIVDRSSKPCGSEWKTVKDNWDKTSIAFATAGPGIYRYRVAALRPNADGGTMVSEPATAQGEPTEIEIKEAPPETSTPGGEPGGDSTTPDTQSPEVRVETKVVKEPTRRVQRAAPQVVQRIVEEAPGYNTELPYTSSSRPAEEAISGRAIDDSGEGEGQRATLIPLAGGALLLVFAMQVHYLNRRAHAALETVPADSIDDEPLSLFDDWTDR